MDRKDALKKFEELKMLEDAKKMFDLTFEMFFDDSEECLSGKESIQLLTDFGLVLMPGMVEKHLAVLREKYKETLEVIKPIDQSHEDFQNTPYGILLERMENAARNDDREELRVARIELEEFIQVLTSADDEDDIEMERIGRIFSYALYRLAAIKILLGYCMTARFNSKKRKPE